MQCISIHKSACAHACAYQHRKSTQTYTPPRACTRHMRVRARSAASMSVQLAQRGAKTGRRGFSRCQDVTCPRDPLLPVFVVGAASRRRAADTPWTATEWGVLVVEVVVDELTSASAARPATCRSLIEKAWLRQGLLQRRARRGRTCGCHRCNKQTVHTPCGTQTRDSHEAQNQLGGALMRRITSLWC